MGSLWIVGFSLVWLFIEASNGCMFGLHDGLLLCVGLCIELLFIEIDGLNVTIGPPFSLQH